MWQQVDMGTWTFSVAWSSATVLLAQAVSPELSPVSIAGWTSFGLAGIILFWLAYSHLPAKDKQINDMLLLAKGEREVKDEQISRMIEEARKEREVKDKAMAVLAVDLIDRHDKKVEAIVGTFNLHSREMREDYKEKLTTLMDMVLKHCRDEAQIVNSSFKIALADLAQMVKEQRDENIARRG